MNNKIKSLAQMRNLSLNLKKRGCKIVTLNGSFDLFHFGHLYSIIEAKKKGDVLVIGLNSDRSYKKYKNSGGPLIDQDFRSKLLTALEYVDFVVIFNELNPIKFLDCVKPDVHCVGFEYDQNCIESKIVQKNGGKIHIINPLTIYGQVVSTSNLVEKIVQRHSKKIQIVFLDRDGIINQDKGYTYKIEDFKFVSGVVDLLLHLKKLKFQFVIISNQSGIAKGYFSEVEMQTFNQHMLAQLKKNKIIIKASYYCPYHPTAKIKKYRQESDFRKPYFAAFSKAKKEYNIDMSKSWSLGDKLSDCIAGKRAGVKTILLKSKYVRPSDKNSQYVDYFVTHLNQVKSII